MNIRTSVIILSWNGRQYLGSCLNAILKQSQGAHEILLVDNGSIDGSVEFVITYYPTIRVIQNHANLGVAGGWNVGLKETTGDIVVFVNQDVIVRPDWLFQLNSVFMETPEAGVIGCKLLYPDEKTIQHAGGKILYPLAITKHYGSKEIDIGQYDALREVDYVTGAAFGIRRDTLCHIGLFDDRFFPAYYEDVDICVRARQFGYKVLYSPNPVAVHYESTSLGKHSEQYYFHYHQNRLRFVFKHLTMQRILYEFLPAEIARVRSPLPLNEINALRKVYTEGIGLNREPSKAFLVKVVIKSVRNALVL